MIKMTQERKSHEIQEENKGGKKPVPHDSLGVKGETIDRIE